MEEVRYSKSQFVKECEKRGISSPYTTRYFINNYLVKPYYTEDDFPKVGSYAFDHERFEYVKSSSFHTDKEELL